MANDVKKFIGKLDASKSCGLDKIPDNLLKDCNEIIAPYLTALFLRLFPDDRKMAKVHQFLKPVPRKIATITGQFPFC